MTSMTALSLASKTLLKPSKDIRQQSTQKASRGHQCHNRHWYDLEEDPVTMNVVLAVEEEDMGINPKVS